jgi:uncharacterized protein YjbI with pentapeptide repeats
VFYIRLVQPRHLPTLVLAALLLAVPAYAACTSPAAPEVVWRRCLLDGRDLTGVDLSRGLLRDSSLQRTRLMRARMVGVDAIEGRFVSADMTGADLTEATLRNADFTRAILRGANFSRADLRGARLFRADMTGADLTGADLTGADFSGAILDGARWTDGQRLCAAGSVGTCQ